MNNKYKRLLLVSCFLSVFLGVGMTSCGQAQNDASSLLSGDEDGSSNVVFEEEQNSSSISETSEEMISTNESSNHVCNFIVENNDEIFLRSTATCEHKATFYKSCECGNLSEEYFECGETIGHIIADGRCKNCKNKYSEGLVYEKISEGNYRLIDLGTCTDTHLIIPDRIYVDNSTIQIVSVGRQAIRSDTITDITVPLTIKKIYTDAFALSENFKNIYYSGTIADWCNVKFVRHKMSWGGSGDVELRGLIGYYAKHFYFQNEDGEYYEPYEIHIPNNLDEINDFLFMGCHKINKLFLPKSVKVIGSEAFYRSSEDISIFFYGDVMDICDLRVESLGINRFSSYSFYDFSYFTRFYMLNNDGEWYEPTEIIIPDGVTKINNAFELLTRINKVVIPHSVVEMSRSVFSNCYQLVEIYNLSSLPVDNEGYYFRKIYDSLDFASGVFETEDGFVFFKDEDKYLLLKYKGTDKNLYLPETIYGNNYSINNHAFNQENYIENIFIPKSVEEIGIFAFHNCASLKNVFYDGSVEDWCAIRFRYLKSNTLVFHCYSNPMDSAEHFFLKESDNQYKELHTVVIPNSISEVGACQFSGFDHLYVVELNENITKINQLAFFNCDKLGIIINNSSILNGISYDRRNGYIGYNAFIISKYNDYESTYDDSFYFIRHLDNFYLINSVENNKIRLPEAINGTIYFIASNAFLNDECIEEIAIPNSIDEILKDAFKGCTNLKNVYFDGTIEEWNNILFANEYSNPLIYAENLYLLDENGTIEYLGNKYTLYIPS